MYCGLFGSLEVPALGENRKGSRGAGQLLLTQLNYGANISEMSRY